MSSRIPTFLRFNTGSLARVPTITRWQLAIGVALVNLTFYNLNHHHIFIAWKHYTNNPPTTHREPQLS